MWRSPEQCTLTSLEDFRNFEVGMEVEVYNCVRRRLVVGTISRINSNGLVIEVEFRNGTKRWMSRARVNEKILVRHWDVITAGDGPLRGDEETRPRYMTRSHSRRLNN